jgi:hypothetical protein
MCRDSMGPGMFGVAVFTQHIQAHIGWPCTDGVFDPITGIQTVFTHLTLSYAHKIAVDMQLRPQLGLFRTFAPPHIVLVASQPFSVATSKKPSLLLLVCKQISGSTGPPQMARHHMSCSLPTIWSSTTFKYQTGYFIDWVKAHVIHVCTPPTMFESFFTWHICPCCMLKLSPFQPDTSIMLEKFNDTSSIMGCPSALNYFSLSLWAHFAASLCPPMSQRESRV